LRGGVAVTTGFFVGAGITTGFVGALRVIEIVPSAPLRLLTVLL
jgi:hypothetical protein